MTELQGDIVLLTRGRKHKVNLQRMVLRVDSVLAGSVEVKLRQLVVLAAGLERSVDRHLHGAAQVLELGSKGVRVHGEGDGVAWGGGNGRVQHNGRLVLAGGTELVGSLVEAVPVQRALDIVVAKGADGHGVLSGVEMGSVVTGGKYRGNQCQRSSRELNDSSHLC
jgi:hypothetical protein